MEKLFPVLLQVLSDAADDVVQQDLQVLAAIMSYQYGKQWSIICQNSFANMWKILKMSYREPIFRP